MLPQDEWGEELAYIRRQYLVTGPDENMGGRWSVLDDYRDTQIWNAGNEGRKGIVSALKQLHRPRFVVELAA